ncbi:hypothetical protein B0H12DRAFT_1104161 [Mycena haematopus]|nr:hypothetical protein B0H12DRAFT_1104161 [Mycena haematopus]
MFVNDPQQRCRPLMECPLMHNVLVESHGVAREAKACSGVSVVSICPGRECGAQAETQASTHAETHDEGAEVSQTLRRPALRRRAATSTSISPYFTIHPRCTRSRPQRLLQRRSGHRGSASLAHVRRIASTPIGRSARISTNGRIPKTIHGDPTRVSLEVVVA